MGGRKNELSSYEIFKAADASLSLDNKLNPTNVTWLDNAGISVQWTGNPVGEMKVWVSNDAANPKEGRHVQNWTELDFGTPVIIDGTNQNLIINMNQLPFVWLAVGFEQTSGAGTLSAQLTSKEV